jgi:Flp pilus assembly protein TadG
VKAVRNPRRRRESGHTMMEASFILVPFLAMFFAMYDFGMAIFLKNTMQFAVRQGVRYAVTSQVQTVSGSPLGQDASIKNIVSQNSFGFLNYVAPTGTGRPCSGQGCIYIRYYNPNTLVEVTGTNSNAGGNVVQVSAENLTWAWMVPLMRSSTPLSFSVASADVMEPSPSGGIPPR